MTGRVRYGAKAEDERRSREIEATSTPIWSQAVTVVFETDPEVIAQVLPQPLVPSVPTARLRFAVVDMGNGLRPFGAGWFGVRARHGSREGEYALFMPMSTEQAVVGGREVFGEPKKLGDVRIERQGDRVHAWIDRLGYRVAEVQGTLGAAREAGTVDKTDFYFKFQPSPDGKGFDDDPRLVYCHKHEIERDVRAIDGTVTINDSPLDPIADFPVLRVLTLEYGELASRQHGEIVERVPSEWLLPFQHQRYDDLSVLGK